MSAENIAPAPGADLPAGRALDALVAERVMGLVWDGTRCGVCGWPLAETRGQGCVPGDCCARPIPDVRADEPPRYSTDIAAAWQVVEKVRQTWALNIYDRGDMQFCVTFGPLSSGGFRGVAPDLPLAICRAALAAVPAGGASR